MKNKPGGYNTNVNQDSSDFPKERVEKLIFRSRLKMYSNSPRSLYRTWNENNSPGLL